MKARPTLQIIVENCLQGERRAMNKLAVFELKDIRGIEILKKTKENRRNVYLLKTIHGEYYSFHMEDQKEQIQKQYLRAIASGALNCAA